MNTKLQINQRCRSRDSSLDCIATIKWVGKRDIKYVCTCFGNSQTKESIGAFLEVYEPIVFIEGFEV